ncbi:MAG: Fe(3+) ABC transporter substrate-binding protein [Candidatus Marinimicrobia bacterium]|nr:Fe(3+) ABC transporter substrate-binding protein [Candidatus Neomarinimicrobiota bacterium]OUW50142.1 MAG: Fe(3+) ABC transporter substrate-binding protein [bacterium TMED190]|tara:strand:+ start:1753 stop:2778 length:1026 start_codon:yes stop_codon:yes gene_type:complete
MKKIKITLIVFLLLIGCSQNGSEVNIYTSRHYDSDDELYALFTEKTGIQVNVISGKGAALIERIKAEGENSPADIYFTVDAGNLWKVQSEGFFQSISSNKINSIVPENLRGPNNEWIAIAKRARVIFYNPKKISKDEIKNLSYEDLSNPKWKGRIVIRSSNNMYNQSLVASLISNNGIENTEIWGKGLISNFARKPQGNDRSQIMAVANEEADLAIANSYYIGLMLSGTKGSEQLEAAKKVSIHFPNQNNRGAHINISGAGILKSSPNSKNAIKFLEFLLSEEMQKNIVNNSYEYPILENIDPHPLIKNFGTDFKEDRTSVTDYGELNPEAIKLMDRVGWK